MAFLTASQFSDQLWTLLSQWKAGTLSDANFKTQLNTLLTSQNLSSQGLAIQTNNWLSRAGSQFQELSDWLTGSPTGGYTADGTGTGGGYYPLTGFGGQVVYLPSPATVNAQATANAISTSKPYTWSAKQTFSASLDAVTIKGDHGVRIMGDSSNASAILQVTNYAGNTKWSTLEAFSDGSINASGNLRVYGLLVAKAGLTVSGNSAMLLTMGDTVTAQDWMQFLPTGWGAGKPYLAISKYADAKSWGIGLWDGASNAGILSLSAGTVQTSGAFEAKGAATLDGTLEVKGVATFDSNVNITGVAKTSELLIDGAAGTWRTLMWRSGGVNRWEMDANPTAESGGNVGSEFDLYGYSDDAKTANLWLRITRATGKFRMPAYGSGLLQSDANGTLSSSYTVGSNTTFAGGVTLPNNQALRFTDTGGHTSTQLVLQADNNLVLYVSSNTGGQEPVLGVYADDATGKPVLGVTAAGGMTLNGNQLYFEQGTWAPQVHLSGTDFAQVNYAVQNGWYLRVGNWMLCAYELNFTPTLSTSPASSGQVYIGNLPHPISGSLSQQVGGGVVASFGGFINWNGYIGGVPVLFGGGGIGLQGNTPGNLYGLSNTNVNSGAGHWLIGSQWIRIA